MAFQYHPDKNNDNKYAIAWFTQVKEAYETLTTPHLKQHYLQERWLAKVNNTPFDNDIKTPENVLFKLLSLHQQVSGYDEFRHNKISLADSFDKIINVENIKMLNDFNDTRINEEIITQSLGVLRMMQYKHQQAALEILQTIQATHKAARKISFRVKELKQLRLETRLRPFMVLLILIIICMIIALSS